MQPKQIEVLRKIRTTTYLCRFASKLAFSFDSISSGPFSSNFLVGFRSFDSFQFWHLTTLSMGTAAQKLCFLFSGKLQKSTQWDLSRRIFLEAVASKRKKNPSEASIRTVFPAREICWLHFLPLFLERASLIGWLFEIHFRFLALCRVTTPS